MGALHYSGTGDSVVIVAAIRYGAVGPGEGGQLTGSRRDS